MSRIITIDPITRISGFLEIKAEVDHNIIINATSSGLMYRGFETMLQGRYPPDAIYFTERICGICSSAHAFAASLAVEDALNVIPSRNDHYIRELIHGFEFIQNHIRHFYILNLPSYVRISSVRAAEEPFYTDFRLPPEVNQRLEEHYAMSMEYSMLAHQGLAVLGGKAPHTHGIFFGGATVKINPYNLEKVKSLLRKLLGFVTTIMQEDSDILSEYYSDYFEKGISYPNLMSFGVFDNGAPEISYVGPGVMVDGVRYDLTPEAINEQIRYAWYRETDTGIDEVDLEKPEAYTFIKAPRYNGLAMEVGPLARMILSGEYTRGYSCMDRNVARVLETEKVTRIMINLTERIQLLPNGQSVFAMPVTAEGIGLIDTTRGALGHWLRIGNSVIQNYNIISPSVWNISPRDIAGNPGPIEQALIGSFLNDVDSPVEIGRIVRSFDPCVSCATHLIQQGNKDKVIEVLV